MAEGYLAKIISQMFGHKELFVKLRSIVDNHQVWK